MSTICLLSSCAEKDTKDPKNLSKTKFDDFENAAKLHSNALELFYEEVVVPLPSNTRAEGTKSFTKEDVQQYSSDIINRLMRGNQTFSSLVSKYDLNTRDYQTRGDSTNPQIENFIGTAFEELAPLKDYNLLKTKIVGLCKKAEPIFSEAEHNHIMFALAIYLDSFCYWQENIDKWDEQLGKHVETRGFITPQERAWIREAAMTSYAQADAYGAVTGGVGALLYAPSPWSFAVGWLWGAVTASIYEAA